MGAPGVIVRQTGQGERRVGTRWRKEVYWAGRLIAGLLVALSLLWAFDAI
jgi:hypothetical protein